MIVGLELKGHEAARAEVSKEKNSVTLSLSLTHTNLMSIYLVPGTVPGAHSNVRNQRAKPFHHGAQGLQTIKQINRIMFDCIGAMKNSHEIKSD